MIESPFSTKEGYAMREDTVVQLRQPGTFSEDPLTEILRLGARRLLAQAVEMEVLTTSASPTSTKAFSARRGAVALWTGSSSPSSSGGIGKRRLRIYAAG